MEVGVRLLFIASCTITSLSTGTLFADAPALRPPRFSDYPGHQAFPRVTPTAWRRSLGDFGETFVRETLRLRGYEVYAPRNSSGHGIDLIAIKRGPDGELIDPKLCEVKTGQNRAPSLNSTKAGRQLSRTWLANALKQMLASEDPAVKKLALEFSRFRKLQAVPLDRLSELYNINIGKGSCEVVRSATSEVVARFPLEGLLRSIKSKSASPAARAWAGRQLPLLAEARRSTVASLKSPGRTLSQSMFGEKGLIEAGGRTSVGLGGRRWGRVAGRWVGRAGVAALIATEAYLVRGYRSGDLNTREFATSQGELAGSVGGAVAAGAIGGAIGGPAGTAIGGILGGVAGSLGGRRLVAGKYDIRDEKQALAFEEYVYRHYGVSRASAR